jgi:hypothetical protein
MKIRNGKCDTFDGILDKIWLMLEQGATHSEDPFHWPVLGTTAKEGCSLRTVLVPAHPILFLPSKKSDPPPKIIGKDKSGCAF